VTIIKSLAKRLGFEGDSIVFIPISAFEGVNLVKPTDKMPWFDMWSITRKSGGASGQTLLEAIEQMDIPIRMSYRPLRVPIHSVYKLGGIPIVLNDNNVCSIFLCKGKETLIETDSL